MSNAWEDDEPHPDFPSGFGCEFVLETTEQGEWAILRLQHLMAFQILLEHGRYPAVILLGHSIASRYGLRSRWRHQTSGG